MAGSRPEHIDYVCFPTFHRRGRCPNIRAQEASRSRQGLPFRGEEGHEIQRHNAEDEG